MKHFRCALAVLILTACLAGCNSGPPDKVVTGWDEKKMATAVTRARSEMARFLQELKDRRGEDFAVKVKITDGDKSEHFWLSDVVLLGGDFRGRINNRPEIVSNVKAGQQWTTRQEAVEDWMFRRDGKIHGNYTICPLLETMPEQDAARYRDMLAEPCVEVNRNLRPVK